MAKHYRGDDYNPEPPEQSEDVEEALAVVEQIEETIEGLPERAQARGASFFEDVLEKSKDVGATIEKTNRVTDKQKSALLGWLDGVKKWVR